MDTLWRREGDGWPNRMAPSAYLPRLWHDSLVFAGEPLRYLIERA